MMAQFDQKDRGTMFRMLSLIGSGFMLALLAACQPPAQLLVENAHIQLSPVQDSPSVLYFTVRGGPQDTVLRSVSSPSILRLQMHETVEENGLSMMRPLTAVAVPKRGKVAFEPGGRHVMVWGIDQGARNRGTAEFVFSFSTGEKIAATATIKSLVPADGSPAGKAR